MLTDYRTLQLHLVGLKLTSHCHCKKFLSNRENKKKATSGQIYTRLFLNS